ncbi:PTS sugar transporter subunit IIB [Aerococcaceae bacterium zg-ZJ1578]|uniref:PTS sugar transporter subunit IIB n=1 Tax=Aerococcaceae bacterium zg-252 TaxID=2796928 RepID=UPI001A1D03D9|nr:PTS sugar transporter subunit IIB [Aerococcaceae bacterium zg-1578]MBR7926815.1 PTS sugar transporter subunit IIB [Aerococcaceae bacterium zg-ZUI334]
MKKLLIMCGSGIATSTVVMKKVESWLKENGLDKEVKIIQSKIASEVNHIDDYDAVLTTTAVPDKIKDKVINGVPLLTGIGTQVVFDTLKTQLEQ